MSHIENEPKPPFGRSRVDAADELRKERRLRGAGIYIDTAGRRVETQDAEADPVKFYPQGGGFERRLEYTAFHARFLPAPEPAWRAGTVTAEWFVTEEGVNPAYPCYSDGSLWNGFGMPYFTKETIDKVLADYPAMGEQIEWVGGKLMQTDPSDGEIYQVEPFDGLSELLYPLGAGFWTWDAVEFDKPHVRIPTAGENDVLPIERRQAERRAAPDLDAARGRYMINAFSKSALDYYYLEGLSVEEIESAIDADIAEEKNK